MRRAGITAGLPITFLCVVFVYGRVVYCELVICRNAQFASTSETPVLGGMHICNCVHCAIWSAEKRRIDSSVSCVSVSLLKHEFQLMSHARLWYNHSHRASITLCQFFVGTMISKQPLYIQGINATNQEITKESAFGAMGMFIFLFSSSMIYLCYHKCYDEEEIIR